MKGNISFSMMKRRDRSRKQEEYEDDGKRRRMVGRGWKRGSEPILMSACRRHSRKDKSGLLHPINMKTLVRAQYRHLLL